VRGLYPYAKPNKARLRYRVAVGDRRNEVVVQVKIRVLINIISYLTLPDDGERRWERMNP
jgi:hypothetical protein